MPSADSRTQNANLVKVDTPYLELLEDRCVPATLVVNTLLDVVADDDLLSLREAIEIANTDAAATGGDSLTDLRNLGLLIDDVDALGVDDNIVFDFDAINGNTLFLESDQLAITAELAITANGNDFAGNAGFATDVTLGGRNMADDSSFQILNVDATGSNFSVYLDSLVLSGGSAGNGGGLQVVGDGSTNDFVIISNSVLTNNTSTADGGAIHVSSASLELNNSWVDDRDGANIAGEDGGGIYVSNGELGVFLSTIHGNRASGVFDGGGIWAGSSTVQIGFSTISGNQANIANAAAAGGGILATLSDLYIYNSTISGNQAGGIAGGIFSNQATEIINSTIVGNQADLAGNSGGGGGLYAGVADVIDLANTIIGGNTDETGGENPDLGSVEVNSNGFNVIGDTTGANIDDGGAGTDIVNVDISTIIDLVLADNGGPTHTHALIAGSAAIDAGNNADALFPDGGDDLFADQRGVGNGTNRFLNGTVDIGAVEYAVGQIIVSPADGSSVDGTFTVTLNNVFDGAIGDEPNTILDSIIVTNGTISNFVDNDDGTATFEVTPTGTEDVTIEAYNDSITVSVGNTTGDFTTEVGPETFGAFQVTATPDDGTLTLDDITATNAFVRSLIDNGDGTFTFTVAPNGIGPVEVTADGVNGMVTTEFDALTYGETQTDFITNLYRSLFDRAPSQAEVDYWLGEMENGLTIKEVIANFFASDEFTAGLSNEGIVNSIYQVLFGRDAETDFWTNQLDSGADVFTVALGILNSDEANTRFAQETYNLELRRPADEGGLEFWSDQLALGATIEEIQQGMANTEEGQLVAME